jgi:hypothetical protein
MLGCPPTFRLKRKDAKNGRNRESEIAKKWVCFASFSQNSDKVIHMRKQKQNEAKLKRKVSEKRKSGRKRE